MALSPSSGVAFRESFSVGVCEYVTIMIDQDVTSATHATDWMDLEGSDRQKIYPLHCSDKKLLQNYSYSRGLTDWTVVEVGAGGIIYISLESLQ